MCKLSNCPLSFLEVLTLRGYLRDLTEDGQNDPITMQVPVALLLYDVCTLLGLEPQSVLGDDTFARVNALQSIRPWPTLTEAEVDELAETDAVREGVHSEWYNTTTEAERVEMFRRE